MNGAGSVKHVSSLLVISLLVIVSLTVTRPAGAALSNPAATQLQQDESDQEGVTFDNLLPADGYSFYVEARDIGQQVHSSEITSLIEPLKPMLEGRQNEYTMFNDFMTANADTLSHSRLMVAIQPSRESLPFFLMAVELASADAAESFEQKLRDFLGAMLKSKSGSYTGSAARDHTDESAGSILASRWMDRIIPIKRAGRLIALSLMPFTFKGLRAQSERSMSDDLNFRTARDRFYSETLFIYYDQALSARVMNERMDSPPSRSTSPPKTPQPGTPLSVNEPAFYTEPELLLAPPSNSAEGAFANAASSFNEDTAQDFGIDAETSYSTNIQSETRSTSPKKNDPPPVQTTATPPAPSSQTKPAGGSPKGEQRSQPPPPPPALPQAVPYGATQDAQRGGPGALEMTLRSLISGHLFSSSSFPDAVALGLSFESDSLAVRLLMLNAPGTKMGPILFLPLLVSGPPQASNAAAYMPSDTDVFLTASLDFNQLYDFGLSIINGPGVYGRPGTPKDNASNTESPIAALEKRLGFKIKEDLLSTLGNEVAVGVPAGYLSSIPPAAVPLKSQTPQAGPVLLISVRNKEALQAKLKLALEAVRVKAPNEKGVTEKFDDVEINTYRYGSVAFIDNFLVITDSAATMRRVLEARAKDQTLMTSRDFHSYMRWQPRETVAQLYVSSAVLKDAFKNSKVISDRYDDETKQFLARFSFDPEPITYAATSDAAGPLYEIRIPKNLLINILAEMTATERLTRGPSNEAGARSFLNMINESEKQYRAEHGRFGTLEEIKAKIGGEIVIRDLFDSFGYKLEFTVSGDRYAATATPAEYGKTGKLSFYTDNTGIIRGADHGGRPATAADNPWTPPRDY